MRFLTYAIALVYAIMHPIEAARGFWDYLMSDRVRAVKVVLPVLLSCAALLLFFAGCSTAPVTVPPIEQALDELNDIPCPESPDTARTDCVQKKTTVRQAIMQTHAAAEQSAITIAELKEEVEDLREDAALGSTIKWIVYSAGSLLALGILFLGLRKFGII